MTMAWLLLKRLLPVHGSHIIAIRSLHSHVAKTQTSFHIDSFRHPLLSDDDLHNGTKLGIDSWADTGCAGRHAYVEEFIIGQSVTASGFATSLGRLENLPIANVLYAYDKPDGSTILLVHNNVIYLGDNMDDSLANPIQSEEHGVRIDLRPRKYYPNESTAQSIVLDDGRCLPIEYHGVLPFLPVRRPTPDEIDNCERVHLTSPDLWDPFIVDAAFCRASSANISDFSAFSMALESSDPISSELHMPFSPALDHVVEVSLPEDLDDDAVVANFSAVDTKHQSTLSPSELSRMWNVGLATARRTLHATTHKCYRTTGLLAKRFRTDKAQLKYKQLTRRNGTFYVDFLKTGIKSVRGFIGGTIYTNKSGFKKFFPCSDEKSLQTSQTLRSFIELVGLPASIHSDNHRNFKEGMFRRLLRKFGIFHTFTEPHSPWQNRAEPAIGEIKRYARQLMRSTNTPIRLWCFCYEYSADVLNLCASGRYDLQGRTPYESVMNYTPDISEYVTFKWFQWCYYFDEGSRSKTLCRWLGPSHGIGQAFCSYLLTENGEFIARSSVIPVPTSDLHSDDVKNNMNKFMDNVETKIGNHKVPVYNPEKPDKIYYDLFLDPDDDDDNVLPYGDELIDLKTNEIDDAYLDALDTFLGAKVVVPGRDSIPVLTEIRKRKRDSQGNPIGEANNNPILDTRIYELEFPDGRVEEYSVNTIIENMVEQLDPDGWDTGMLQEIISIRKDQNVAIPMGDDAFVTLNGIKRPVITTRGWDVQVRWQDESTSWIPLADIKESNPIQVAEYAIANDLAMEPAFRWWVTKVLRKRDRIIKRVQRCHKLKMKFGVEVPETVPEALELDRKNGNTLWADAIKKEMKNSRVAFNLLGREERPPVGFKEITCHLIFDVKMDLTRKARYVAGGHLTDPPSSMTYSSVVSRDSVRLAFLVAALNDLNILAGDIQNAYLHAPTKEKLYFYAGSEWRADEGRPVVIVRALYGLKSSALMWRNHLADTLGNFMGFQSSLADPDVWLKAETSSIGFKYYAYILVYVDDILIIDKNPRKYMDMLEEKFPVKPSSIEEPKLYLGANIGRVEYPDGSKAWTMSSDSYVKEAIRNVKQRLQEDGFRFNKKLSDINYSPESPYSTQAYRPELDLSVECTPEQTNYYQNLILLRQVRI